MGSFFVIFLRALAYSIWVLPRSIQLRIGQGLGWILLLSGYRVQTAVQNLRFFFRYQRRQGLALEGGRVFKKNFQALLLKHYFHIGNLMIEVLFLFGPMPDFVKKRVHWTHPPLYQKLRESSKGVIVLASHLGNWEILAAAGGLLFQLDLLMVTKRLKPTWLHQAIQKGRADCQVRATYEPKTLRDSLSQLKKGGAVGLVLDQYLGPPVGVRVPFLGIPVGTSLLAALLAKRTQASVVPVSNYRTDEGDWNIELGEPIDWESHEDTHYELAWNTARYQRVLEQQILKAPEQWLWTHRRFKGNLAPLEAREWFLSPKKSHHL